MRNFLIVTGLSALLFMGLMRQTIDINFWSRLLYNKEYTPEKKKKIFKAKIIIWAILTVILSIVVLVFGEW